MARNLASSRLLEAIAEGPLVLEAAMGTRLIDRGLNLAGDDPGLWNGSHPELVLEVHQRDVAGGAAVLVTNTFGLNRPWLDRLGRESEYKELNRAACELAWRAAGPERFVLGGIGPAAAGRPGAIGDQAGLLLDHGVAAILLETFDPDGALLALGELESVRSRGAAIVVSLWKWPEPPGPLGRRLVDAGADLLGINCEPDLEVVIGFAEQMAGMVKCPLFVKPSVDRAGKIEGSPAAFARAVPRLIAAGARLIGGCCGSTEEHVAAIARECQAWENPRVSV